MATIGIRTFGGLQVHSPDGRAVTIPSRKAQALLAYLAMTAGQLLPRDKLAAMLWEDRGPVQARASLRQELFVLRKVLGLGDDHFAPGPPDSLALAPGRFQTDAIEFERLLAQGGAKSLDQAVELYHGAFLEAFNPKAPAFESWLMITREQLADHAAKALTDLLILRTSSGSTAGAIETALRLVSLDPLQEIGHRALMQLYANAGRTGLALRQFHYCRDLLARELGVRPEPETESLFKSIQLRRRGSESPTKPLMEAGEAASDTPGVDGPLIAAEAGPDTDAPELRQIAVLSAEASDAGSLNVDEDPEHLQLKRERFAAAVRSIVEDHGGLFDRQLDGRVVAFFGIPAAHTDDHERSVRAALEIAGCAAAPGGAKVGVASGRALVTRSGRGFPNPLSVTGDAIHRAALLGDAAALGEVLVADDTFGPLSSVAKVAERRLVATRPARPSLAAWLVQELRDPGTRPPGNHLVGRQAELNQFAATLETCRQSGRGLTWYVRGEPGIGKTRLVEELQGLAAAAGFGWHLGLVLDFGGDRNRNAIRAIAESLLGMVTTADRGCAGETDGELPSGSFDPRLEVHLHHLLQRPMPTALRSLYDAMDSGVRAQGQRAVLADVLRRASEKRPRVLVIEDAHWADETTLSLAAALAAEVTQCPGILVVTTRNDKDPLSAEWRAAANGAPQVTVDLGPLHRQDALLLADALSPGSDDFNIRCVERAGGNPLFLSQLVSAEDRGQPGLPVSVQSVVLARMDALATPDRHALRAASVLGQLFHLDVLRHLVGDPLYRCRSLVERGLVRPMGQDYLFGHALLRDGVYSSLPRSERQRLHRLAAEWFAAFDPVARAEHLDSAEAPEAAGAYLEAARHEATAYRQHRALTAITRGLALADDVALRAELLCCRGDILQAAGSVKQARLVYDEAAASSPTEEVLCRILLGLAAVKRIGDDLDGAVADVAASQAIAERLGLIEEAARAHFLRGNLLFPLGQLDGCLTEHQQALRLARQAGSAELEAIALGGIGDAEYMRGRMASANAKFRRCVELSGMHGFGRIAVANRPMIAATLFYMGDLVGMLQEAKTAIEQAKAVVHPRAEIVAHTIAYGSLAASLQLDEAMVHIEQALAMARQIGAPRFEAESLVFRGDIHRLAGRRELAMTDIEAGLAVGRLTGMAYMGPWYLGLLAVTTDDARQRRGALEEGEALLSTNQFGHNHIWFRRYAIQACLQAEAWTGMLHHADALERYTQGERLASASFFVARARALAALRLEGPNADLIAQLRRLKATAVSMGFTCDIPDIQSALDPIS